SVVSDLVPLTSTAYLRTFARFSGKWSSRTSDRLLADAISPPLLAITFSAYPRPSESLGSSNKSTKANLPPDASARSVSATLTVLSATSRTSWKVKQLTTLLKSASANGSREALPWTNRRPCTPSSAALCSACAREYAQSSPQ